MIINYQPPPKHHDVDCIPLTTAKSVRFSHFLRFGTLFVTVVFCCRAAAGMGTMSALEHEGYRGSDVNLLTAVVGLALVLGWLIGRASIFLIYGPTLLGVAIVSAFRWIFLDVSPSFRWFSLETVAACFVVGASASLFLAYKFGILTSTPSSPEPLTREEAPRLEREESALTPLPEKNEFVPVERKSHPQSPIIKMPAQAAQVGRPAAAMNAPSIKHGFSPKSRSLQTQKTPARPAAQVDHLPQSNPTADVGIGNTRLAVPSFKLALITYCGRDVTSHINIVETQALGLHIHTALQGKKRVAGSVPPAKLRILGRFNQVGPTEFIFAEGALFTHSGETWTAYDLPAHIARLWRLRFH